MERLIEILEEIQPGVDYANCKDLVDGHTWSPSLSSPWWQSWRTPLTSSSPP